MKRAFFFLLPALLFCLMSPTDLFAQEEEQARLGGGEAAPGLNWQEFEEAVAAAQESGKALIIDIYAPWCGWCTRLQNDVYMDQSIQDYINETFIITRLDIDNKEKRVKFKEYDLTSAELAGGLGAQGTPTTVFLTSDSQYITRLPGFVAADEFIRILQYIGTESYKEQTYQEYTEANTGR